MTQQDYWNVDGKENSLSAGYHGHIGRVNYSVAYTGREVRNGKKTIACGHSVFPSLWGRVEQLSHDYRPEWQDVATGLC